MVVVVVVDVEVGGVVVVTIAVVAGATEVDVLLTAIVIGATLEVVGAMVDRDVVGEPAADSLQGHQQQAWQHDLPQPRAPSGHARRA